VTSTIPPVIPILVSAYECRCQRCGHDWVSSACKCPPWPVSTRGQHEASCLPPKRCPGCASPFWQTQPAYRRGQGTSRATMYRRRAKAAEKIASISDKALAKMPPAEREARLRRVEQIVAKIKARRRKRQ
jgi:hypothetical protein